MLIHTHLGWFYAGSEPASPGLALGHRFSHQIRGCQLPGVHGKTEAGL